MYIRENHINILWKEILKTEFTENRDEYLDTIKSHIEFLEDEIESNRKWIVFYWVVLFFSALTNIIIWLSLIW